MAIFLALPCSSSIQQHSVSLLHASSCMIILVLFMVILLVTLMMIILASSENDGVGWWVRSLQLSICRLRWHRVTPSNTANSDHHHHHHHHLQNPDFHPYCFCCKFFLFTVSFLWRKPCCVSYLHNPQSCQLRRSKVCHMAFVIILIKMIMVELMIWTAWCGKWMRTKWEQSQLWLWRSFWSSALMIGPQHWISVKLLTRSPDLGKYRRHASIWISSCRIYKISDGFRRVFLAGPQMSFTEKLTWLTKSDRHGSLMWLGEMLMLMQLSETFR